MLIELHNMKRVDHITKIYRIQPNDVIIVIYRGSNFILFNLKLFSSLHERMNAILALIIIARSELFFGLKFKMQAFQMTIEMF